MAFDAVSEVRRDGAVFGFAIAPPDSLATFIKSGAQDASRVYAELMGKYYALCGRAVVQAGGGCCASVGDAGRVVFGEYVGRSLTKESVCRYCSGEFGSVFESKGVDLSVENGNSDNRQFNVGVVIGGSSRGDDAPSLVQCPDLGQPSDDVSGRDVAFGSRGLSKEDSEAKEFHGTGSSGISDLDHKLDSRGKNYERNQVWKEERKQRKLKRQLGQRFGRSGDSNWRRGDDSSVGFSQHNDKHIGGSGRGQNLGFFSSCSEDVQRRLRESRAALFIAENEKRLAEVQKRTADMKSDVALVREVLKLNRTIEEIGKKKNDANAQVAGWAKTVVSTASNELVRKAASERSSIPSLESIEISTVDLKESQDSANLRKDKYNAEVARVRDYYTKIEMYHPEEMEADFAALEKEYIDVLYSGEELIKKRATDRVIAAFSDIGISQDKIDRVIRIVEIDDEFAMNNVI